jgi:hypothetical protein
MTEPFTMASAADLLKNLMEKWEEALLTTIKTGYWKDTVACDRIVSAYGDSIADALQAGKFSGDSQKALAGWINLTTLEANNRREQMEFFKLSLHSQIPMFGGWFLIVTKTRLWTKSKKPSGKR